MIRYRFLEKKTFWAIALLSLPVAPFLAATMFMPPVPKEATELSERLRQAQVKRYGPDVTRKLYSIQCSKDGGAFSNWFAPFNEPLWSAESLFSPSARPLLEHARQRYSALLDSWVEVSRSGCIQEPDSYSQGYQPWEVDLLFARKVEAVESALAGLSFTEGNWQQGLKHLEASAHSLDACRSYITAIPSDTRDRVYAYLETLLQLQPDKQTSRLTADSLRKLSRNTGGSAKEPAILPRQYAFAEPATPFSRLLYKLTGNKRLRFDTFRESVNNMNLYDSAWTGTDRDQRYSPLVSSYNKPFPFTANRAALAHLSELTREKPPFLVKHLGQQFEAFHDIPPAIQTLYFYWAPLAVYHSTMASERHLETKRLLLEAAFLARAYHADTGKWPERIEQLFPDHLKGLSAQEEDSTSTLGEDLARYYREGPRPYGPIKAEWVEVEKLVQEKRYHERFMGTNLDGTQMKAETTSSGRTLVSFDIALVNVFAAHQGFAALVQAEHLRHRPSHTVTSITLTEYKRGQGEVVCDENALREEGKPSSVSDLHGSWRNSTSPDQRDFRMHVEMELPQKVFAITCNTVPVDYRDQETTASRPRYYSMRVFPEGW